MQQALKTDAPQTRSPQDAHKPAERRYYYAEGRYWRKPLDWEQRGFLSINETAEILGIHRTTLYKMQKLPGFPPKYQISERRRAYRTRDIIAWMESRPTVEEYEAEMEAAHE